jgi:hypothetical protein
MGPTQPPIQRVLCLSPGVKRPGRDADHPLPSSAGLKEIVDLYIYYSFGPLWPVLEGTLPLPLSLKKYEEQEQKIDVFWDVE